MMKLSRDEGRRFVFLVFDKEAVEANNLRYLTKRKQKKACFCFLASRIRIDICFIRYSFSHASSSANEVVLDADGFDRSFALP